MAKKSKVKAALEAAIEKLSVEHVPQEDLDRRVNGIGPEKQKKMIADLWGSTEKYLKETRRRKFPQTHRGFPAHKKAFVCHGCGFIEPFERQALRPHCSRCACPKMTVAPNDQVSRLRGLPSEARAVWAQSQEEANARAQERHKLSLENSQVPKKEQVVAWSGIAPDETRVNAHAPTSNGRNAFVCLKCGDMIRTDFTEASCFECAGQRMKRVFGPQLGEVAKLAPKLRAMWAATGQITPPSTSLQQEA